MNVTNVVVICLGGSVALFFLGPSMWRRLEVLQKAKPSTRNTAWPVMGHKGKAMDQLERCSSLLPRTSQAQRV